jgi:Rrf2 family protein
VFELSKRARMGLYVMAYLARDPDVLASNDEMAQALNLNVHHLAKVTQALCRAGWLSGNRGAKGGYSLKADPKTISMAAIVKLLDGDVKASGKIQNRHAAAQAVDDVIAELSEQAYYTLESVTVSTLVRYPKS